MWQDALQDLVASTVFRTQQGLVDALHRAGHSVTQSSVSRELQAQGVRKVAGRYRPAKLGGLPPGVACHGADVSEGGPLVVLHTDPADAPRLGQAIDRAGLAGVLGTLAGDDTVFIALASGADPGVVTRFVGIGTSGGA